MSQTDRDRLVALKKAKDRKITQRAAAEELKLSERQVRAGLVASGAATMSPQVAASFVTVLSKVDSGFGMK